MTTKQKICDVLLLIFGIVFLYFVYLVFSSNDEIPRHWLWMMAGLLFTIFFIDIS